MIMKLIMIDDLVTDGSSKTHDGIESVMVIHYGSEQPGAGTSHHSPFSPFSPGIDMKVLWTVKGSGLKWNGSQHEWVAPSNGPSMKASVWTPTSSNSSPIISSRSLG